MSVSGQTPKQINFLLQMTIQSWRISPLMSRYYAQQLLKLTNTTVTAAGSTGSGGLAGPPPQFLNKICPHCCAFLLPGISSTVQTKRRKIKCKRSGKCKSSEKDTASDVFKIRSKSQSELLIRCLICQKDSKETLAKAVNNKKIKSVNTSSPCPPHMEELRHKSCRKESPLAGPNSGKVSTESHQSAVHVSTDAEGGGKACLDSKKKKSSGKKKVKNSLKASVLSKSKKGEGGSGGGLNLSDFLSSL